MDIEFDPVKDALNVEKHGISLLRVVDLDNAVFIKDTRFSEERLRLYGTIDGKPYCAAITFRNGVIRAINLRRAHAKEYLRHAR